MNHLDDVQPPGDPLAARPGAVVSIGHSEADKAAAFKERARKLLIELAAVMDEAMRDGLSIRFASIGINAWGKHEAIDLHVVKRF